MATATLELVNPYAKYGLKRRPTYDEIANLISENEQLTGALPNRDATFFKKTPQGSFFDGTDHLELLKEEQNRIMERQMREIILRQNARLNGTTFNLNRLQSATASTPSSSSSDFTLGSERGTLRTTGLQTELAQGERRRIERQQQTGDAHRDELSRQSRLPTLDSFLQNVTSPLGRMLVPSLPIPRRQPETIDLTRDEDMEAEAEEEFFPEEMTTAREEAEPKKSSNLMKKISYSTNISNWSEKELEFQLYIRGSDVNSPELSLEGLRRKGQGKGLTNRQHYRNLVQNMIDDGRWKRRVEEQLLQSRIKEYKNRNRPRGSRDWCLKTSTDFINNKI